MLKRLKGFTFIELIAVMMIVSIIAAYFTMRTPSTTAFSLSSTTELLRRNIRYTQALALNLNTTYTLTILAGSYSISPTPPEGAISVTMPTGITLSPVTISFNSMGAPASAATITITASGVGSNVLTVSAETGFVSG